MTNLGPLPVSPKTGYEPFREAAGDADFALRHFWAWSSSNLMSNATRGVLAEFIVGRDVGADRSVRGEWDEFDLELDDGTRIEIKSAAYLQTWDQKQLSQIRFGIAPTKGDAGAAGGAPSRHSDVYVFCLLESQDQATVDPLDLGQWSFFVLATRTLDAELPKQKSLGLAALRRLQPVEAKFGQIAAAVASVLER